jgi:hypothetical protein
MPRAYVAPIGDCERSRTYPAGHAAVRIWSSEDAEGREVEAFEPEMVLGLDAKKVGAEPSADLPRVWGVIVGLRTASHPSGPPDEPWLTPMGDASPEFVTELRLVEHRRGS